MLSAYEFHLGMTKVYLARSCVMKVADYVRIVWFRDEISRSNEFLRLDMNGATIRNGLHRLSWLISLS